MIAVRTVSEASHVPIAALLLLGKVHLETNVKFERNEFMTDCWWEMGPWLCLCTGNTDQYCQGGFSVCPKDGIVYLGDT